MPLYSWKCTKCEKGIDIVRSIHDSQVPPSTEDFTEAKEMVEDADKICDHAWEKQMAPVQKHNYGPSFGYGRKGHW